ncbi:MAG: MerR family transcriptional regulator [Vampirovibrionales bacterium]|nr:MerR family transcriptional regulator [Vampirovibrionales bacterium]
MSVSKPKKTALKAVSTSAPSNTLMLIGDVANAYGVTSRTLRYYEELGLITASQRQSGQSRLYDTHAVKRIQVIVSLQACGFSLTDIQAMLVPLEPAQITPKAEENTTQPSRYDRWKATYESLLRQSDRLTEKIALLTSIQAEVETRLTAVEALCGPCQSKSQLAACDPLCEHHHLHEA